MSEQHPEFSLDRNYSIEHSIDSHGRKWNMHSSAQHPGLVWARPEPDREDAQIPKQFTGKWTSKERLQDQINQYLKADWDKAEVAQRRAAMIARAAQENKLQKEPEVPEVAPVKKTAEESLAELPQEVRDLLGETIATGKSEDELEEADSTPDPADPDESLSYAEEMAKKRATKKKVAKKKVSKSTQKRVAIQKA